ncbi:NAD-binding protein [Mycena maculata]|uniref:NAD-binding protein n=1 Tax=Mycena maculata TaxID=230809 RepID=A0AAD7N9T7_9AGAR|nr:NAD-binding protein [Mycena maculata]
MMGNFLAKIAPNSDLSTDLYPPSSKFEPQRDIPDLTGKIVLVTGRNTGIGYHTVKHLLLKNAKVYLAARSAEKGAAAIHQLEKETGKKALFLQLDLADLVSVRRAATEFLEREPRLDILFNNGGVMICPTEQLTAQNHDIRAYEDFLKGRILLLLLSQNSGQTSLAIISLRNCYASYEANKIPARIINTSSSGHKLASTGIDFASLKSGPARNAWLKKFSGTNATWRLYGESKLGNILVSNYFARTHSDVLVSCALHPGSVRAGLQKHLSGFTQRMLDLMLPAAPMGAYTQLWAGTSAPAEQITGQYLIPWARVGKASPIASSNKLEEETMAYLKEQVKGF